MSDTVVVIQPQAPSVIEVLARGLQGVKGDTGDVHPDMPSLLAATEAASAAAADAADAASASALAAQGSETAAGVSAAAAAGSATGAAASASAASTSAGAASASQTAAAGSAAAAATSATNAAMSATAAGGSATAAATSETNAANSASAAAASAAAIGFTATSTTTFQNKTMTAGGGNALEATSGPGGSALSHRNRVINGNFRINQRGYVSGAATTVANQYTLDRWRVVVSGQSLTFAASGNGNLVTAPAGGIEQVIEAGNIEGGTYTLNWTGTATAAVDGVAVAKGAQVTLTANTATTLRFSGGTVTAVQLEPGNKATPFEHRSLGLELALCQRYFVKNGVALGAGISTTIADFAFVFPVEMRAAPSMNVIAGGVNLRILGSTSNIGVTMTQVTATTKSSCVQVTRTSGTWAAGNPIVFTESGAIEFSAEL